MKNNSPSLLEVDLKLGFICNQNCRHCAVAGKRHVPAPSFTEVCTEIEFYRDRGAARLVLTGGEPTLRRDLVEIVRYAARGGFDDIHLQTNATGLANGQLASQLAKAGLTSALVSLHGPSAEVHDRIVRHPDGFAHTVAGLHTLQRQGVRLATNTVVTRDNVAHLLEIVQFVAEEFPGLCTMCFSYPQVTGGARTHFQEIVPRLSTTTAYLLEALPVADRRGIWCWVSDFPLCGLPGYEEHSADVVPRRAVGTDPSRPDGENRVTDYHRLSQTSKVKPSVCADCDLAPICLGVDAHYIAVYGSDELNPRRVLSGRRPRLL
ncbi:MAG: radical SAM protein [Anaerolineae bacterium]|nr:radical SAM protein [Anaerolineae bacterium]